MQKTKFDGRINRTVMRAALRYFGGKFALAPWIIENMPPHTAYIEPFGGGGSVLLRKNPAKLEVYNDLDDEIVSIFRVLQNPEKCRQLVRLLTRTPWSRREYSGAFLPSRDPVIRAQRAIIRSFMSVHHSALFDSHLVNSFAGRFPAPVKSWSNYPRHLVAIMRRLKHVVIECRDAMLLFDRYDAPDTLFFVDPPYVPATRDHSTHYRCDMTESDHVALLNRLKTLQGTVMLAGYPSALYDRLLPDWQRLDRQHYAKSHGARMSVEALWIKSGLGIKK